MERVGRSVRPAGNAFGWNGGSRWSRRPPDAEWLTGAERFFPGERASSGESFPSWNRGEGERTVSFHLNLETETVDHAYPKPPLCVDVEATVADAVAALNEAGRGGAIVVENGRVVGVFTERDVLQMIAAGESLDQPLRSKMTPNPVTVRKSDTVGRAIELMATGGYRRLPIVDDDHRPIGTVTVSGILHYLVEHFPTIVYTLPPRPHHTLQEREGA